MVYVGPPMACLPNRRWPWPSAAKLVADTGQELAEFGARLGLKIEWLHNSPDLPHFDLTAGKRAQALRLGATEIGNAGLMELVYKNRERSRSPHGIVHG